MDHHTEKQTEKTIDRLAVSTRSPRGKYTAVHTRLLLERRITTLRRRRFLRIATSAAAVTLLCIVSLSTYFYVAPADVITVSTLANNQQIQLPDGTAVTLNRYTTFSYPKKFKKKNREVQLQGGAYFAVSKDKTHPFIVQTETVDVQVLGTEFNVEAYTHDERVQTVLLEGSVAVSREGGPSLLLTPGEKAVFDKKTGSLHKETFSDPDDLLAWKQGDIIFHEQPLKEIARRLSNAFDVQIRISNPALEQKRMSARFMHDETLEQILLLLEEAGNFRVNREEETLYLIHN